MKSIKIRIFFWSIFSCIQTRKNSVFGHFSHSGTLGETLSSDMSSILKIAQSLPNLLLKWQTIMRIVHWVKSVRIQSYSGPHFPVFGLNAGKYDQNNSEYGHFSGSCGYSNTVEILKSLCFLNSFW